MYQWERNLNIFCETWEDSRVFQVICTRNYECSDGRRSSILGFQSPGQLSDKWASYCTLSRSSSIEKKHACKSMITDFHLTEEKWPALADITGYHVTVNGILTNIQIFKNVLFGQHLTRVQLWPITTGVCCSRTEQRGIASASWWVCTMARNNFPTMVWSIIAQPGVRVSDYVKLQQTIVQLTPKIPSRCVINVTLGIDARTYGGNPKVWMEEKGFLRGLLLGVFV